MSANDIDSIDLVRLDISPASETIVGRSEAESSSDVCWLCFPFSSYRWFRDNRGADRRQHEQATRHGDGERAWG